MSEDFPVSLQSLRTYKSGFIGSIYPGIRGHFQTILPAIFRKPVLGVLPDSLRLDTGDGDFLGMDHYRAGNSRVGIISHGLEGSSRAPYVLGMVSALLVAGWDVIAWNFRSCGGEMNRLPRFYHSGETGDLHRVIQHALGDYPEVALVGFSLGGNMMLKYLGEDPERVPEGVRAAVAFSVPCDLESSAGRLDRWENRIYTRRFLRSLRAKVQEKARLLPGIFEAAGAESVSSFREFDDQFTAPVHGFRDALDYWRKSSCRQFLPAISIPTLVANARNDPFLTPKCFPVKEAEENENLSLEMPTDGGHIGFRRRGGLYWSEGRTVGFLKKVTGGP